MICYFLIIIIYIYNLNMINHLMEVDWRLAQLFGVKWMSFSFLLPEVLRELRLWSGGSSCPWGAVGLAILALGCLCWISGFICAAACFSVHFRRFLVYLARGVALSLQPSVGPGGLDLQRRLGEYQRNH